MQLSTNFNHQEIEHKWYSYWLENDYFSSKPDERDPYTIVIPPPNITGVLHMGHMLNNTIQDILIRRARLQGKNACWVPGTDHASIATEAKVVQKLKENGIEKNNISREEFLSHAWEWKNQYGNIILDQLKKIGCSCDWSRTKFTLDDSMYESVVNIFIKLFNDNLIYRGYRMVNWDPEAKTTLSDEEVIFKEKQDKLYYIKYPLKDSDDFLTIATTRPETMLGDTALCVNPKDNRYKDFIGKTAVVPIINREILIISDSYVDIEYGTGCLKVTPAHDYNDKDLGEKYKLDFIDIFNDDGTLNEKCLHYNGMDRFDARKKIINELDKIGLFLKQEDIVHNVGFSERTGVIIEPKFSFQWFLKMESFVEKTMNSVLKTEEIKFFPKKFKNTFKNWMENIRDWNISRQLYWGHQIPVYFLKNDKEIFVAAKNKKNAITLLIEKTGNPSIDFDDIEQDKDVLDTWFSSWLWPISVFNGINDPENSDFKYYFPTNDLVTGPDILFFWVSRMIMASYKIRDINPFENVYFTGIVRDKQRRKMSKSLGNSPDAIKLIDVYGADGVRVGLMLSAAAGNDLLFDKSLCEQGRSFSNKIWNSYRLLSSWKTIDSNQPDYARVSIKWYNEKFNNTLIEINNHFDNFRISDALMSTYKLLWDDFCSFLLEIIKPGFEKPIDKKTKSEVVRIFEKNLQILHPFMPFISEELWHLINDRKKNEALVISNWPKAEEYSEDLISNFENLKNIVSGIRNIRKKYNIPYKKLIGLKIINNDDFSNEYDSVISKICNISKFDYINSEPRNSVSFRINSNFYYIEMNSGIDMNSEIQKIKEDIKYLKGFLHSVEKKLSNQSFSKNAPKSVIEIELKKQKDSIDKIKALQKRLNALKA